jgi:hypothetical protein
VHVHHSNGATTFEEGTGISQAELAQALERVDGSDILLVVDACYSGQLLASSERRAPINARGFAQLAFEKGISIIVASTAKQVARESDALGHGDLTFALVEGLRNDAVDRNPKDGAITVQEWFEYGAQRVPELHLDDAARGIVVVSEPRPPASRALERQQPVVFFGSNNKKGFVVRKLP